MNGLMLLFGGRGACAVDWKSSAVQHEFDSVMDNIKRALSGCVLNRLSAWFYDGSRDDDHERGKWKGSNPSNYCEASQTSWKSFLTTIAALSGKDSCDVFDKALYFNTSDESSPRYRHQSLQAGDAVELLVDESRSSRKILSPSRDGERARFFLQILALAGWEGGKMWAAAALFSRADGSEDNLYRLERASQSK